MSEKRFVLEISSFSGKHMKFLNILDNGKRLNSEDIVGLLNEQQATIEHLTKSRDKWSKSAKLHSEYFDCLEKAIEIAYEEKPYPKIEDIMNIYSKLEKEINDE